MKLWGGRFSAKLDPAAWEMNRSLDFDRRLAPQDVRGSIAWAHALQRAGVLTSAEAGQICTGLEAIAQEFSLGTFEFQESDEDIHTAVERRLGELIGPLAGKLHTGRSRNDQVATDLRLWLMEHIPPLSRAIAELQTVLLERAQSDLEVLMPGYTHLQRAQPILLGHWWLFHFWPLQRDRQRLLVLAEHTASLPLGSGALAGAPFPVDRQAIAQELGFASISANSLDGVSDRDFVAEFLFCAALAGVHLSKLSEAVILFSTAEFGYFVLSDRFATGSSLMPQKKNPDLFELARGKAGALIGQLAGLLATLKALPSTYDKDLQEDKIPLFSAYDSLSASLPVLAEAIRTVEIRPERMRRHIESSLMATDLADLLVAQGIPFRTAHGLAGKAVQLAETQGKPLDALQVADLEAEIPEWTAGLLAQEAYQAVFDPLNSVSRRQVTGGTAPQAVARQIEQARQALASGENHQT
ncbi:MAG: argininosuccinate lyase [Anaerolineales bacterium]|jgi:argininosuccinate lyase